jgi:hypothetical protein
MALYVVLIPPLLCVFGLLVWSGQSYSSGTGQLLSQSRSRVRAFPDKTRVRSRLEQMGRGSEYENFRLKQISWASLGAGLAFLFALLLIGKPFASTILSGLGSEARQNQRNILMDKAGKAEISMMIPVVFLILPISVLFALWPSLTHLSLFAA